MKGKSAWGNSFLSCAHIPVDMTTASGYQEIAVRVKLLVLALLGTALCVTAQVRQMDPGTPLLKAVVQNDTAEAERLLAAGADPNEGNFVGFPPVFFVVINQNLRLFRAMKAKGVDIHAKEKAGSGSNLLMWAAHDEAGRPEMVEELLKLGLDPNQPDQKGDTALTWALRKGSDTPAVRALRNAGATTGRSVDRAVESAIALLQKSGAEFTKVSGCSSCHHQSLPQMAIGMARTRGINVDEQVSKQQVKAVISVFRPAREQMLKGIASFPDVPVGLGYSLIGLAAEGYAPDDTTEAMAHLISLQQQSDGSFRTIPARPPMESSEQTATALSIRALQFYGKSADGQIQRAADWLKQAPVRTTEDRVMQLLGLRWANTDTKLLKKLAAALASAQREDGGWSQLPGLESDAYATGEVMVALAQSGVFPVSDPVYRRGVDYLLRTQLADGSWFVRTRTFPVQPLKDSGYPHGKNQWISAAGSSWAAMALSMSLPLAEKSTQSAAGL